MDGTDLAGRTAVVTGASRGLGREIAGRLAASGARVVEEGADTAVWLARRGASLSDPPSTGRLWEDRVEVPW